MLFHPHIHVLVPAVGLAQSGCELSHPRNEEYLLPEKVLANATRTAINEVLAKDHSEILCESSPRSGRSLGWPTPRLQDVGVQPCVTLPPM